MKKKTFDSFFTAFSSSISKEPLVFDTLYKEWETEIESRIVARFALGCCMSLSLPLNFFHEREREKNERLEGQINVSLDNRNKISV